MNRNTNIKLQVQTLNCDYSLLTTSANNKLQIQAVEYAWKQWTTTTTVTELYTCIASTNKNLTPASIAHYKCKQ